MPSCQIYKLQMSRSRKLQVISTFLLGAFVVLAGIIRCIFSESAISKAASLDVTCKLFLYPKTSSITDCANRSKSASNLLDRYRSLYRCHELLPSNIPTSYFSLQNRQCVQLIRQIFLLVKQIHKAQQQRRPRTLRWCPITNRVGRC